MIANISQARDEILATFRDAWEADETSAVVPVLYWDIAQDVPNSGPWARVTVRHSAGNKSSLSNEVGSRRFTYVGTIFVQIFTVHEDGMVSADVLADIAMRAFEGNVTSGGVIFRQVRLNEVGQDGQWFQTNVLVDFEYDNIH
jgi:hypothetical protein